MKEMFIHQGLQRDSDDSDIQEAQSFKDPEEGLAKNLSRIVIIDAIKMGRCCIIRVPRLSVPRTAFMRPMQAA